MPKFRSITVSIVSQIELRTHPEFPHPHSEEFRVLTPVQKPKKKRKIDERSDDHYEEVEEEEEEEVQEYSYSSRNPNSAVSVYVPSCPGTRFWIRFSISPDHPPAKLFFFKLYLNGRHITSWGTNPRSRSSGQVMRALFNPESEENGQFRPAGIQSRPFFFSPQTENEVAMDGGLIEIKVFRARGRRLRAANPEDFRGGQEHFGLDLPRGALLDCPEDAHFYDWLLVDPKDSPYASFRFHYRSWENLEALSLIPPELPRTLLTRAASMWSVNEGNDNTHQQKFAEEQEESEYSEESTLDLDTSTFSENFRMPQDNEIGTNVPVLDRPPTPFLMPLNSSCNSTPTERMLPVPPPQRPRTGLRRTSSQVSSAPSITPSLHAYLDRESNSESPEPIIGVACAVPLLHTPSIYDDSNLRGHSPLSVDSPKRQNLPPGCYGIARPPEAMFSPETVAALRKNKQRAGSNVRPTRIPMARFYHDRFKVQTDHDRVSEEPSNDQVNSLAEDDSILEEQEDLTVGLSGSVGVLRTPSSVKRNHEHVRVEGVWSPSNAAAEEDSADEHQSRKDVLENGQLQEHTRLPLPIPGQGGNPRQRVRTWI